MGKMKRKYESGAATAFIGRNQAIKKLQLTLADFRRLCILKGVYPIEPKNKKKVNKGTTANRTYYYVKDINYLAHEPIINKFRDFKVYVKRLKRAKGRRDIKLLGKLKNNKPSYKIDHIVKERYPSFTDAIKDLDDCLSLIFLFSILPKSKRVYVERVHLARRLSLEFMHYVIASNSLRKCFISIKGYYFQADIKSQRVTWIMPHKLAYQTPDDVDFRIMSTFVEFYSIMMGFVNYKCYNELGLIYPPKLSITQEDVKTEDKLDKNDFNDEFLASLNCDFIKIGENDVDNVQGDEFHLGDEENIDMLEKAKLEEENLRKLKTLFHGLKFFLNREVPREQFVLAIRSFSGQVSWDKTIALGATFNEDDTTITHHIIDRPLTGKTYINRVYVQPQWVFDCINENMLLPVDDYLPGAVLPPHLSPFVEVSEGDYVPPEKQRLIKLKLGIHNEPIVNEVKSTEAKTTTSTAKKEKLEIKKKELVELKRSSEKKNNGSVAKNVKDEGISDNDDEIDSDEEDDTNDMRVDIDTPDEEQSEEENEAISEDDEEELKKKKNRTQKPVIAVVKAKTVEENINKLLKKKQDEEKKLSEMMIPKKNKRLYDRIMHGKKKKRQEVVKLQEKREKYEQTKKKAR